MVIHIKELEPMRTVQMILDDELVLAVDQAAKNLQTTRSAFTRDALRQALSRLRSTQLEQKHRRGYEQHPIGDGEFLMWESEQNWG